MTMYKKMKRFGVVAVALALPFSAFALRVTMPALSMQQLTTSADEVVVGEVVEAETRIVGKRFETTYKIHVNESLKTSSREMSTGNEFEMTMAGGAMTTPPLTQYVFGMPYMAQGEEVVLFLKEPQPQTATRAMDPKEVGKLRGSYTVVGWNQGRFSVLTDPDSGEKMVTRVNLEDYGLMNTSEDLTRLYKGLKEKQIPMIRRALLRQEDSAAATRAKDPLEVTPVDMSKLTVDQRRQQAEVMRQQMQRQGIPVQSLDSFKEQVLQFSNQ